MGVTSDIGERTLGAIYAAFPVEFVTRHFGWCYPHDNNTVFGICWCCPEDRDKTVQDVVREGRRIAAAEYREGIAFDGRSTFEYPYATA